MKMMYRILLAFVAVLLIIGGLGTVKGLQIGRMVAQGKSASQPPQTVTAAIVREMQWETTITAVGSLEAVQGVLISTEFPGKVIRIAFDSGKEARRGQILIEQDVTEETARLRAARSEAILARKDYERAKTLHSEKIISSADLDERTARYEQAQANVDTIEAVIAKKTIRAPFDGRLGIRQVNLGEFAESGSPVVSLQNLNPIFVDFQVPQKEMIRLAPGLVVHASVDGAQKIFEGVITAINPEVDPATRNVHVQATIQNREERLRPGMYVNVSVILPERRTVLTIPSTAVHHAPYSDSVYLLETKAEEATGEPPVLRQQFVKLGEQRGDFVVVLNGLEKNQRVVSTGVFKLRNGQAVVVNNDLAPEFELSPRPENS